MKWEADSIFPIKVAKIILAGEGNGRYEKSQPPGAAEGHRSLTLARAQVAERVDDDQELLQGQESQQQHRHLRGQRGQEAQEAARYTLHPQQRVLLILPSVLDVKGAHEEQVHPHEAVGTCGNPSSPWRLRSA